MPRSPRPSDAAPTAAAAERRGRGRPRHEPRPGHALVTAPGVTPVVTVADLEALAERMHATSHATVAAALGISRPHLTHLYRGTRSLVPGSLLTLLEERLRTYGVRRPAPARRTGEG